MSDKRTFVTRNKQILGHCLAYIGQLSLLGQPWQIDIRPYVKGKSAAQRRLFHAWVGEWAKFRGDDPKALKVLIKDHCDFYEYVTNPVSGKVIPVLRSTEDLTMEEYTHMINTTEILAARGGYVFEKGHDYFEALGIEQNPARGGQQEDIGHGARVSSQEHSAALRNGEI